jgi:hypothetical protein
MEDRILEFIIDVKNIVKYPKEECKGLRWWDCKKCCDCYLEICETLIDLYNIEDNCSILKDKKNTKKFKNFLFKTVHKIVVKPIIYPIKYELFKENKNKYIIIIKALNRHTNYSKDINDTSKNILHINFIEHLMYSLKELLYRHFIECEIVYGLKDVLIPTEKYIRMMRNYVKRCALRNLNLICLEKFITCRYFKERIIFSDLFYLFDIAGGNYKKIKYYDYLFYNEWTYTFK